MTDFFIDLNRQFKPTSIDKNDLDSEQQNLESLLSSNNEPLLTWQELIKKPRVVILAEPGTGKTIELEQAAKRLIEQGKKAFFCRIELLQKLPILDCLDIDLKDDFENWTQDGSIAWFFLDSVDEAKLTDPKNFEYALRRLASQIGNHWRRARIIVSCRVHDWYAYHDFKTFIKILKYPKTINKEDNGQFVLETNKDSDIEPKDVVHHLMPLNKDQTKIFVREKGIQNADEFMESLLQNDFGIFADRPQDLIELIDYWLEKKRFGGLLEMLQFNIAKKLAEIDPDRSNRLPMTAGDTKYGAERLAAATTYCKKNGFVLPDKSSVERSLKSSFISPESIIPEWNSLQIKTLLSRAIFDEAIYGTVRFHHRMVREYLTARWLKQLLAKQTNRRKVESLLFPTQYGRKVIPSSMQPIVAWLAIWDTRILRIARDIAPEIFFRYGDPSSFPLNVRRSLLIELTKKYDLCPYPSLHFDFKMLKRFASQDLSSTIEKLLIKYTDNKDIRNLLLTIIWQGRIQGLAELVSTFALDSEIEVYSRIYALDALKEIDTKKNCQNIIQQIITIENSIDAYISGRIIILFYPETISVEQLLQILEKTEVEDRYSSLDGQIEKVILAEQDNIKLKTLLEGIIGLITREPLFKRDYFTLSTRYQWLIRHAITLINKFIISKDAYALTPEILSLYLAFINAETHLGSFNRYQGESWREPAREWSEFRYQFFWNTVRKVRQIEKPNPIKYWWQVNWRMNGLWQPVAEDLEKLFSDLDTKPNTDDKLVALSAIFKIYVDLERPRKLCCRMKKAVKGTSELELALHNYFNPPPKSEQQKERERQDKLLQSQQLKREQERQRNQTEWLKVLNNNLNLLQDVRENAEKGSVTNAFLYVYQTFRDKSDNSDEWTDSDWHLLIEEFGEPITRAFCDGCKLYWRYYNPCSQLEWRTNSSIPYALIIGLLGLSIEARDDSEWLEKLSHNEAAAAARYIPFELNGFPSWFTSFYEVFPEHVDRVLLEDIVWEISKCDETSHGKVLSILSSYDYSLPKLYKDKIIELLEQYQPKNYYVLENSLLYLLKDDIDSSYRGRLYQLSYNNFEQASDSKHKELWLAILLQIQPNQAIQVFKSWIEEVNTFREQQQRVISFCGSLNRRVRLLSDITNSDSKAEVESLKILIILIYKYVKPSEDIRHEGTYSPDQRDYAQRFRDSLVQLIVNIPGQVAYNTLMELNKAIIDKQTAEYLEYKAIERATLDAELEAWEDSDIAKFSDLAEKEPRSQLDLFNLTVSRLDDLKLDLEEGDDSNAAMYLNPKISGKFENKIDEEIIRNSFAYYLGKASNDRYTIDQENEYADGKRTDIRFNAPSVSAPIPMELKISDRWTYSELLERIENQLIKQYMNISEYGVFLLVYQGEKSYWQNDLRKRLCFTDLVNALQLKADRLAKKYSKSQIEVIGIDFNLRFANK